MFHPRFDSPKQKFCSHKCIQWPSRAHGVGHFKRKIYERTERVADCWIWQGCKNSRGYGDIFFLGRTEKAHRAAYIAFKGDIPDGMFVCHSCDNPSCVNPAHLWLGTHSENMADMREKGRAKTSPQRRKLTDDDILEIRSSTERGSELARKFNVSGALITLIRQGKKHKMSPASLADRPRRW